MYEEGQVRAIGVSNFLDHHVKTLFKTAHIKPTVNQIELHPKLFQKSTIDFCKENDIVIESCSLLVKANYYFIEGLSRLLKSFRKTLVQLRLGGIFNMILLSFQN